MPATQCQRHPTHRLEYPYLLARAFGHHVVVPTTRALPNDLVSIDFHPRYIVRCSGTMLRKTPDSTAMRTLLIAHSSILVSVSIVQVPI